MASHSHQRSVHPKISSMPRKHSEATTHLEIYKMSVEKNRLQQELQNLKSREKQIIKRLAEIEEHTETLMSKVHSSQASPESPSTQEIPENSQFTAPKSAFDFQEVYLEY